MVLRDNKQWLIRYGLIKYTLTFSRGHFADWLKKRKTEFRIAEPMRPLARM